MQTLIIGNGFDIDHNLPTKYKDFLCFIEEVNVVKGMSDNKIKKIYLDDSDLKTYIKQLFLASEKTQVKNEVISLLEANMWIDYFLRVKEEFGDNWIDFESEISQVVQELENVKDYVAGEMKKGTTNINVPDYMKRKLDKISFDAVAIYKDGSYKTINEYISKWVNDLNGMIRLLEIYLCDYVQNIKIEYYSPDIFELNPDRIISFNYTDTYEKMYSKNEHEIRITTMDNKSPYGTEYALKEIGNVVKKVYILKPDIMGNSKGTSLEKIIDEVIVGPRSQQNINILRQYIYSNGLYDLADRITMSECPLR